MKAMRWKEKKNQILSWPEATWGYALDHKWFQLRWAAVEDFQPGWKREREIANETHNLTLQNDTNCHKQAGNIITLVLSEQLLWQDIMHKYLLVFKKS